MAMGILALPELVIAYGLPAGSPLAELPWDSWPVFAISSVVAGYLLIVIMRTIGLYYRHFKADFAWTAE